MEMLIRCCLHAVDVGLDVRLIMTVVVVVALHPEPEIKFLFVSRICSSWEWGNQLDNWKAVVITECIRFEPLG
jgi:hypothetical protein